MAKKTTLKEIADMLAHVVKHMATKDDIEKFATKEDAAALEKTLTDRIDGVNLKVDAVQKSLDNDALARQDQKLPDRMARVEKHLGLDKTLAA